MQAALEDPKTYVVVSAFIFKVCRERAESAALLLKECRDKLDEIKSLLEGLTPRQLEEIFVLSKKGKCRSIEDIELDLRELSNDRCELSKRTADAPLMHRVLPSFLSQLRTDIGVLKTAVESLLHDTWNTTSRPSTEAKKMASTQAEHPSPPPPPPLPPTAAPITNSQSPDGGPEEYPLVDIRPPPTADPTRHGLPRGLV